MNHGPSWQLQEDDLSFVGFRRAWKALHFGAIHAAAKDQNVHRETIDAFYRVILCAYPANVPTDGRNDELAWDAARLRNAVEPGVQAFYLYCLHCMFFCQHPDVDRAHIAVTPGASLCAGWATGGPHAVAPQTTWMPWCASSTPTRPIQR